MSANNLGAWLKQSRERLLWVDFEDYAHHVFAADTASWRNEPTTFVNGICQAQEVIGSDVLSIDLLAPYVQELAPDAASPAAAIQAVFALAGPREFNHEAFDALAHRLVDQVDLVARIPSPTALLERAGLQQEASFDDLDDVAIAIAALLRDLSTRPLAGIALSCEAVPSADELEALESVTSAARHYEWQVTLSAKDEAREFLGLADIDIDALLLPEVEIAALSTAGGAAPIIGGGLSAAYWRGDVALEIDDRCLRYGEIPRDAEPETVVKRIKELSLSK